MRRTLVVLLAASVLTIGMITPAAAITKGQDDFAHPYVGLLDDGNFACSGTLLDATVMITAAHCFGDPNFPSAYGEVDGAPIVEVTFSQQGFFDPDAEFIFGLWYPDPEFCIACGGGLPGFDRHDLAVVILFEPVVMAQYGALPDVGLVDALPIKNPVDQVGYGVQSFARGSAACEITGEPPCTPTPDAFFTRQAATGTLGSRNHVLADQFMKVNGAKGGTCFGDSGGPNFQGGTNVVLAVTSFGTNGNCAGNGWNYRVDTQHAQEFIASVIAEHGS